MNNAQKYRSAITNLNSKGAMIIKTITGEIFLIEHGPNQLVSLKRDLDRYVANYEMEEIKAG